jgi:hypothetical protein
MSRPHKAHKQAVLKRFQRALDDLYHNATPVYPIMQNLYERHLFAEWFPDTVFDEISSIQNGGAYGPRFDDLYSRLRHAGKKHPYASRYAAKALRAMQEERARGNDLDSRETLTNALWEEIGSYGTLSQWGRGGRTLAPDKLVHRRGGSAFSIRSAEDVAENMRYADMVRLTLVLESFNAYVKAWCPSIPEVWKEAKDANDWQPAIDAHDGLKPYRVTVWR